MVHWLLPVTLWGGGRWLFSIAASRLSAEVLAEVPQLRPHTELESASRMSALVQCTTTPGSKVFSMPVLSCPMEYP